MSDAAPTEAFEHVEHAEHAAHSGNGFLVLVSITIAVLAVFAASVGSLESIETAGTINAKSEAVLFQDKATDTWNFYQAQSIKKKMFEIAAAAGGPHADDYSAQARRYGERKKITFPREKSSSSRQKRNFTRARITNIAIIF